MESLNIQVATQYAIDVADDGQPGLERRSPDVFGKDTTSDGIDDQVGAVLFGGGHDVVRKVRCTRVQGHIRSEAHTSELQSLMRTSYAVFWFTTNNYKNRITDSPYTEITKNTPAITKSK